MPLFRALSKNMPPDIRDFGMYLICDTVFSLISLFTCRRDGNDFEHCC